MHYREKNTKIKIIDIVRDNFLNLVKGPRMIDLHTVSIKKDNLPKNTEVWI